MGRNDQTTLGKAAPENCDIKNMQISRATPPATRWNA